MKRACDDSGRQRAGIGGTSSPSRRKKEVEGSSRDAGILGMLGYRY